MVLSHHRPCTSHQRLRLLTGWAPAPLLHPLSIALVLPVLLGSCFGWQRMFPWVCVSSPRAPSLCCQEQKEEKVFMWLPPVEE